MKTPYQQNFITYCQDLNNRVGGFNEVDIVMNQSVLSFSDMVDQVIKEDSASLDLLHNTDCCVIAHNTYERNPHYAHVGTYLINRYDLSCDFFDVIGEGESALIVAEHLIYRYFSHKKAQFAVVLITNGVAKLIGNEISKPNEKLPFGLFESEL